MKIKRFEAANMSDALKRIKQEFGDDAVILSAKSMKKSNGLLSGRRLSKVVVTAAVDGPTTPSQKMSGPTHNPSSKESPCSPVDTRSPKNHRLKFFKQFNPITRTGQQKLQSKFVKLMSDTQHEEHTSSICRKLITQGIRDAIAKEWTPQITALVGEDLNNEKEMVTALSHVIQAQEIVKSTDSSESEGPRIVVLVGASGAGKTSMAAKLAAMQVRQASASAAFLSFDDRRVAGCAELERFATILDMQMETSTDPDEVASLLNRLRGHQLVVVDTPALGPSDTKLRAHLKNMIDALPGAEVHLLLNADSQESTMAKQVDFFKKVGVQFLGFTMLDWADTMGGLINQAMNFDLPIALLSSTPKVDLGVQWARADQLAEWLLTGLSRVNGAPRSYNASPKAYNGTSTTRDIYYVANRNSDIFHKNNCQSVKRINSNNMLEFENPADAMGQQYKPCRMCCSELLISKPIQRVAYKYASSR